MTTVHPREFIRTLYLGDRGCKSITIDGYGAAVKVQATCISRVRSSSGNWDYYKDEDIVDGFIVFADVVECELQNGGHVPNDSINDIEVVDEKDGLVTIKVSIDSGDDEAHHHETFLRITCASIHLEDPARPGVKITS